MKEPRSSGFLSVRAPVQYFEIPIGCKGQRKRGPGATLPVLIMSGSELKIRLAFAAKVTLSQSLEHSDRPAKSVNDHHAAPHDFQQAIMPTCQMSSLGYIQSDMPAIIEGISMVTLI